MLACVLAFIILVWVYVDRMLIPTYTLIEILTIDCRAKQLHTHDACIVDRLSAPSPT